jgi:hypothetical protein
MIEILKIDHESNLSILFGSSRPWEAPILTFDLLWVESPHWANVALMLQFSFKRHSVLQRCGVCVCVILTSSRGELPSDAVPTARQIHPPHACNFILPFQTPQQPLPGKMLADGCPLGNVDGTATANVTVTIPWLPSGIPPGASLCDT